MDWQRGLRRPRLGWLEGEGGGKETQNFEACEPSEAKFEGLKS